MTRFSLDYAPHIGLNSPDDGMFVHHAGPDPIDQIQFAHDQGFRAIEDNFLRARPIDTQLAIGRELERLGMRLGTFVATFETAWGAGTYRSPDALSFVSADRADREALMTMFKESVETAKRVNASICTVLSGRFDARIPRDYQTANMIENLKWCAEICERGGLTMGLEPITGRQWYETFCTTIPHAYLISKAVGSPACKVIFDAYHVQLETGGVLENLELAWDEIAYVQIADAPGRNEPGTGEMNYSSILGALRDREYQGIVGIEHGASRPGIDGEKAILEALARVDPR